MRHAGRWGAGATMSQNNVGDSGLPAHGCFILGIRLLYLAMMAGAATCLALFGVQFAAPLQEAVGGVYNPLQPLLALLRDATVPEIGGVDVAPLIGAALIIYARYVLALWLAPHSGENGGARVPDASRAQPVGATAAPAASAPMKPVARWGLTGAAAKKRRMELLREIARQKRIIQKSTGEEREAAIAAIRSHQAELQAQEKSLAFMALDVVGSTKMKVSEKPLIIEHAFLAFREWVDGIMGQHGLWKSSWTPDGVMAAFPDLDEAAAAAQDVLKGLRQFNEEGHEMSVPFQLRIGVSQGNVIFDDDARMDEVSHQVIDLAGHLQKYASPDTLLMAKHDHAKLRHRKGFQMASQNVDGYETLEWKP
jgi:class 3 adenylate cyclase/uncharacterized protein YggT (Ycf19 family)